MRQARLRLLAGSVLRHLQQKKPHLAEEKLAEMEALPQSQQGDRPAFLAALRYMVCAVRGADDAAAAHRAEVERVLASKAAAALLIFGVAEACEAGRAREGRLPSRRSTRRNAPGCPRPWLAWSNWPRTCKSTRRFPGIGWRKRRSNSPAAASRSMRGQLQTLAEAGLCAKRFELAYAVSAAGLERGGPTEARFSAAAGAVLAVRREGRWAVCAAAAAQLARQQRQMDVVEKAVELLADLPFGDLTLTPEQASLVVRKEKAENALPHGLSAAAPTTAISSRPASCDCPKCRRARGEAAGPFEDFDEDDDDDDWTLTRFSTTCRFRRTCRRRSRKCCWRKPGRQSSAASPSIPC